tara:strand:+ start:509 stop:850 length:342 start_codon:yes stop_codon:yes gene_type:complete
MKKFVRILMIALIAAFAVGTVAHAASNTAMSLKMVLADGGAMDMADCQGCGFDGDGENEGLSCDIVCVSPLLANLGVEAQVLQVSRPSLSTRSFYDLAGRTGPPEPYPPRTLI